MEDSVFSLMMAMLVAAIIGSFVFAQDTVAPNEKGAAEKSTAEKTQIAVVQGEVATVYAEPNFDAKVLINLKTNQKVRVSQKMYTGVGGFGSFYRVHFKHGRFGYVADVELVPQFTRVGKRQRVEKNPEFQEYEARKTERDPIFFTRYIGATVGMANFSEKFSGQTLHASTLTYGLKMTGPGVIFDGPPVDFNLVAHIGAPSYYRNVAGGNSASGYFVMTDMSLLFPLFETRNNLVYFGAGPLLVYTSFKMTINVNGTPVVFDSQELRLGATGQVAYAHRFGRYIARLEGKYFLEKTQYFGTAASFQVEF